jgi:RNA polymerase sigma-70 factor (ECF subfamily)
VVDIAEPGPSLDRIWEVYQVRLAVDQLADDEREVVRMSHFEGLTQKEIAERLDIPLGTVKSRSHRAHKSLLLMLSHLEEPT